MKHTINITRILAGAILTCALLLAPAQAGEIAAGDLVIEKPVARATPPNAPVSGGYMTIRNTGAAPDRLIGGSAAFAGKVEIHEMKMDGDVMRMREIAGGLEIPPGGAVVLEPGGYHIMFMGLKEPLLEGESRPVTLQFKNAGTVELEFDVKKVTRSGHGHHGGHGDHGTTSN